MQRGGYTVTAFAGERANGGHWEVGGYCSFAYSALASPRVGESGRLLTLRCALLGRRAGIAQQYDFGVIMRPKNAEILAIRGILKLYDRVCQEVRNLSAPGAIQWLEPEIVRAAAFADKIHNSISVGGKFERARSAWIGIEQPFPRFRTHIERNQRNFLHRSTRSHSYREDRQQHAVWSKR